MRRLRWIAGSGLVLLAAACIGGREWRPPSRTHAIVGVNVIPMEPVSGDEARVLSGQTVLVVDGLIAAIGSSEQVEVPADAIRIDGTDRWLIPGLIDAHVHLLSHGRIAPEYTDDELTVLVANGVTGARIAAGSTELLEWRDGIESGERFGPRLSVSSPQLTGMMLGPGFPGRRVTDAEGAAIAVRDFGEADYDAISVTYGLDPETYTSITAEARNLRLPVVGQVGEEVGLGRALEAGQQIEHLDQFLEALLPEEGEGSTGPCVSGVGVWRAEAWATLDAVQPERIPALATVVAESGVWSSPTLSFFNSSFGTGRSDGAIEASPEARFLSERVRAELLRPRQVFWANPPSASRRARYVELRNTITRELHEAGARLMAGSDSPEWMHLGGFSLHRELSSLVQAGLPPHAALEAATRNPAEFLGWGEESGTITVGKRADLVLLHGNPLERIGNTREIEGVLRAGRWFSRRRLDEELERAAERLSSAPLATR